MFSVPPTIKQSRKDLFINQIDTLRSLPVYKVTILLTE